MTSKDYDTLLTSSVTGVARRIEPEPEPEPSLSGKLTNYAIITPGHFHVV